MARRAGIERTNPPEWYMEFHRLLDQYGDRVKRSKVEEAVKAKGDIVMSMYVDLDRLAPASAH